MRCTRRCGTGSRADERISPPDWELEEVRPVDGMLVGSVLVGTSGGGTRGDDVEVTAVGVARRVATDAIETLPGSVPRGCNTPVRKKSGPLSSMVG